MHAYHYECPGGYALYRPDEIARAHGKLFVIFETFCVLVFTVEYLLRVWSCTVDPRYAHPLHGRLRYMLTPLAIIDLLSVLPFFLPLVLPFELRILRIIRLVRVIRILMLGRYSEALRTIGHVLRMKKEELGMTVMLVMILLVISSSLMYYFENPVQPKVFSSIPASMWWGVVTLTTVGYGDIYPVTPFGKFFGALIALLGIGLFALPAGILGSGFVEEMRRQHKHKIVCPHCQQEIER